MVAEYHYDYPVLTSKQAKVLRACKLWSSPSEVSKMLDTPISNVSNMLINMATSGYLESMALRLPGKYVYALTALGIKALKAHDAAVKAYNK